MGDASWDLDVPFTGHDITFITTTQFTPWLDYCKKCVKKHFPESNHLIIDGRGNWPEKWFEWIDHLAQIKTRFVILIDEDCFVLDREHIITALYDLDTWDYTIAGVPDAGFAMRNYNEVALNPFFMIIDRPKLLGILKEVPKWKSLKFKPEYFSGDSGFSRHHIGLDYEPFYGLFWAILETKNNIYYLQPKDIWAFANEENQTPATCVFFEAHRGTIPIALHLWYSRKWDDNEHVFRYAKAEVFLQRHLN